MKMALELGLLKSGTKFEFIGEKYEIVYVGHTNIMTRNIETRKLAVWAIVSFIDTYVILERRTARSSQIMREFASE